MKLRFKFALLSVGVCAVPMAIAGYSAARIGQDAIRDGIEQQEQAIARQVADHITEQVSSIISTLRVESRVLDLTGAGRQLPSRDRLEKFLQFVYHQRPDFSVVGIYDGEGTPLARPAAQEFPRENTTLGRHDAMSPDDAAQLPRRLSIENVLADGAATSPLFVAGSEQKPQFIVGVKFEPIPDEPPLVIAAQISLGRISDYLMSLGSDERTIFLLDQSSRVVAASAGGSARLLKTKVLPNAPTGMLPSTPFVGEYTAEEQRVVGAFATVNPFKMGVATERPLQAALRPVQRMGWATIYWMGISGLVAAVVAASLGRRLSDRVGLLADGARNVAQGRLDTQLPVQAKDELGDLAKTFNAMTTSLHAAREEILLKTREIRHSSRDLERRVEEKTKDLEKAQDMLLRSRSLAAIGGLGAGVAHEINNPLAGVLGLAQLVLEELPADHPARPAIRDIEDQSLRIQEIVAKLLRLSQRQSSEDFRPVDLSQVVDDALRTCVPNGFSDGAIKLEKRIYSPSPPIRGNPIQLQAALVQLVNNARAAMPEAGTLTLETSMPADKVLQLRVTDTGKGIKAEVLPRIFDPFFTTKQRWDETGMGLSVVHKIIEDHGGGIRVESEQGRGTSFFLTFPIDSGAAHLT